MKRRRISDRRATPRRSQCIRILLLTDDCIMNEPYRARILDSSQGGFRLESGQEISEGSFLQIRHARAWDGVPWLPVRVTNSKMVDGRWQIGCQMLKKAN